MKFKSCSVLTLTDTPIITSFLIIHQSHYITGIQPLHFKGGFLTLGWELILFLEAMPDSFLQLRQAEARYELLLSASEERG